MAQDPGLPSNNDVDETPTSPSATPAGPKNNYFKFKYANFVKRVKLSAQKAKEEAKRKRIRQRKIKGYKHNNKIIEAQQSKRNYILSVEKLQDPINNTSENNENEEKKDDDDDNNMNIMDDEWSCIVINKKPKSVSNSLPIPQKAPPPIPHERREEFESNKTLKRSNSNPVQILLNQISKKKKMNEESDKIINDKGSYDEDSFNMDSDLEHNVNSNELEEEDNCNKTVVISVQWEWCDDAGKWHKYGVSTCEEIESYYNNEMEKYEYDIFGRIYSIHFKEMKQYNNLNQAWNVRRNELKQEKWD